MLIWEEPDLENSTGIAAGPWALDAGLAHQLRNVEMSMSVESSVSPEVNIMKIISSCILLLKKKSF